MDTYGPLIQKIRVPQPSLQRLAVISIFRKLRSSASKLDFQSNTSRDALYNCLHCEELAVLDQTVRELCLLVKDGILEPHLAFQELLAGLEACNARSLSLFVKGIGLLCRIAVEKEPSWLIGPPDLHPFVKVFGCRVEVHNELIQQLILQILHMESLNSRDVVKFVRPFLMLTVLQASISSASSFFVRRLLSTLASLACSLSSEGLPIFKTLIESLKYFPWESSEDFACLIACAEDLVDAFEAILKQMAGSEELVNEAQALGTDLMDILLSYRYPWKLTIGIEPIMELSKRVVLIQKSYTLSYLPDFSAIVASLFCILIATEIEHEQLSILKLSTLLVKWRHESEYVRGRHGVCYGEELLFVLPITHLMVSPSKCIKDAAADLLHVLESVVVDLLSAPMNIALINEGPPSTSRPETVVRRLFRYLWLQDHSYSADVYCLLLTCKSQFKSNEIPDKMKSWLDQLRLYCLGSSGGLKSTSVFQLQDYQTRGMPSLLGAVASALVMHQTLGCPAIEALTAIGMMEPRLDVSLLLVTLFYSKILCTNLSNSNEVLVKLLGMLPSLASHSSMVPLIIQTILPMLHRDAKPILIATSVRLLSKTWEVSDRVFAHLRGALLPTAFADSASERDLGISLAASVRDVCKKDADRGVDIILSVSACIESKVSTVQALGLESLGHLCEADVVDFYTAWDVIQQHLLDYSKDPIVACSLCILLRWAATDVEAYPEPSKSILQILVEIATSRHIGYGDRWVKARVSAFKSLNHYEVGHIQQTIPDFLSQKVDWLLSESDPQVLRAIEELEIKIMAYEHVNRRRFGREKKLLVKKVEKLLSVLPQVFFSSGHRDTAVGIYPGTALFCLAFPVPKYHQGRGMQKELQKFQDVYEGVVTEITVTLNLSRNIVFALLAIQSWQIFMSRWIRAIMLFDTEELFGTNERRSTMAADCILKVLCRIAEGSIPRAAENIALAIGSLCMVLPHPAHSIISIASMFLLDWLHQHEHEYKQWPAAISLGLVSGCLHGTDWEKKFHIVNTLLKASSYINGPILSSPICEPLSTSLMQEIFLVARESENQEMRSSAAWSMSFLRNRWLSRDLPAVNSFQSYPVDSKPVSQNFPEDSAVWKFCLWLIDLNFSKMSTSAPANTVASVLRCLARAPRLPSALDWGIIIRRCMKYGDHASINHNSDQSLERGTVRVECLALSFAHAQHVIPLLCFLDELFELARFQLLEVPLKSFLLAHLVDMMKLLSKSRMEKLYNGMFEFFSSPSSSYMDYDPNTKKSLRASFWKGLQICPSGPIGTTLSLSILDKCLDSMFVLLPPWPSDDCDQEWSEAITCLGQAQQEWLVNILLVQETDSTLGKLSNEAAKRIFLRARLVMNDRSPLSELMKLLPYVLNKDSDVAGFWRVLLEVAAAVQCAEISIKQQWLIDTIDIGCITEYPSTALRFLGLLSSCWCHYAVVLISNPDSVLRDLPVTLPSLFLSGAWKPVVEALAAKLWAFLERIHGWAAHLEGGDKEKFQGSIDKSQESMSSFLLLVLHATCIHLKDYLPFELQLRLASMEIV
ncbi:protein RST1 isoform X9 [Amborella trichopoda]|uniref:protein RST1 isoform X9 n=1 Tax=Amborella trichopoda TaxID=13333 RepID=UPI0009BD0EA9|nr:protein RST1 isoform X9 [Amborella trichopoda]|eukprot:XP_020518368.1 protein RST1 isoform X9 [Amborella trichopoda]